MRIEAVWTALLLAMSQASCDGSSSDGITTGSGGSGGARPAGGDAGVPVAGGDAGAPAAAGAGAATMGGAGGVGAATSRAGAAGQSLTGAAGERGVFPGPPGAQDTTAIAMDDPAIVAWATGVDELVLGAGSTDEAYHDEASVLGPATGRTTDVVSLGDSGRITLTFAVPLTDGPGFDLAIFENAVNETVLELAFVEVSSDGETFTRFDSTYWGTEPVPGFGGHDPRDIDGLAGKYPVGFGTPFDLQALASHPAVTSGDVQLDRITQVRIVDIVGDGSVRDSHDHPIYDPYPTVGTAGFDLEAVAVLHAAE